MANQKHYGNLYSAADAATYLGVSYCTLLSYVKKGLLTATDLSYGSGRPTYGFSEEDLIDFDLRKQKIRKSSRKTIRKVVDVTEIVARTEPAHKEVLELKLKIKMLSEELLELSIKLDELSK